MQKEKPQKKQSVADPDELQLLDETDRKWVNAWKETAKQYSKTEVVIPPIVIRK